MKAGVGFRRGALLDTSSPGRRRAPFRRPRCRWWRCDRGRWLSQLERGIEHARRAGTRRRSAPCRRPSVDHPFAGDRARRSARAGGGSADRASPPGNPAVGGQGHGLLHRRLHDAFDDGFIRRRHPVGAPGVGALGVWASLDEGVRQRAPGQLDLEAVVAEGPGVGQLQVSAAVETPLRPLRVQAASAPSSALRARQGLCATPPRASAHVPHRAVRGRGRARRRPRPGRRRRRRGRAPCDRSSGLPKALRAAGISIGRDQLAGLQLGLDVAAVSPGRRCRSVKA